MGKYRRAGCLALAIFLIMCSLLSGCGKNEMAAKTMRLLKVEGDVKLEVDGEIIEFTENQRLVDGNALRTAVASLASVGLDDTKIVTMNESSRAEFHKDGKDIALTVTEGTAFFEVNKELDASENMTVGSPNLMVGIRGTSGVIGQDEKGRPILYLTDGEVEITGVNPDTGETKTIKVKAPVKIAAHYYNDRPQGQTLEFSAVPLEPDMLPAFAAEHIYENEELMQKITEATGWTVTDFEEIHEEIENKNYNPKPSDAFELGVMEADEIDKSLGLGLEEEPPAETEKQEEEPKVEEPKTEEPAVEEPETDDTAQAEPVNYAELARHDEKVLAAIDHFDESGKIILADGTVFDPAYYAANNPDVVKAYGDDPYALLYHYLNHAKDKEDRYANQEEQNTAAAKKVEEQLAAEQWQREQEAAANASDESDDNSSEESPTETTYTRHATLTGILTGAHIRPSDGLILNYGENVTFDRTITDETTWVNAYIDGIEISANRSSANEDFTIQAAYADIVMDSATDLPISWNGHAFTDNGNGYATIGSTALYIFYDGNFFSVGTY